MKAVVVRRFGGPEALEIADVPTPQPGTGQVRIRVQAAPVNPVDIATRSGWLAEHGLMAASGDVGIGWDLAGVVDAGGPGTDRFNAGDAVIGMRDLLTAPVGAQAEQVVLDTDAVAPAGMPPGIYELGGQQIAISTGVPLARNLDGTVAGAATFLDQAVRNLVGFGRDIAEVLSAATTVPADAVGRVDLGRLLPGAHADIVWWDGDLQPVRTWVDGVQVYDATAAREAAAVATESLG